MITYNENFCHLVNELSKGPDLQRDTERHPSVEVSYTVIGDGCVVSGIAVNGRRLEYDVVKELFEYYEVDLDYVEDECLN